MTLPDLESDALTAVHEDMAELTVRSLPNEITAVIWRDGIVTPLGEGSPDSYYISPRRLRRALAKRPHEDALAFFHSHPSGKVEPSTTDIRCMRDWHEAGFDVLWSIGAVIADTFAMSTYYYLGDQSKGFDLPTIDTYHSITYHYDRVHGRAHQ